MRSLDFVRPTLPLERICPFCEVRVHTKCCPHCGEDLIGEVVRLSTHRWRNFVITFKPDHSHSYSWIIEAFDKDEALKRARYMFSEQGVRYSKGQQYFDNLMKDGNLEVSRFRGAFQAYDTWGFDKEDVE